MKHGFFGHNLGSTFYHIKYDTVLRNILTKITKMT